MYGEADKVYVKFGAGESDEMPKDWAERMLARWRAAHPAQFAKYIGEVATEGAKADR